MCINGTVLVVEIPLFIVNVTRTLASLIETEIKVCYCYSYFQDFQEQPSNCFWLGFGLCTPQL